MTGKKIVKKCTTCNRYLSWPELSWVGWFTLNPEAPLALFNYNYCHSTVVVEGVTPDIRKAG